MWTIADSPPARIVIPPINSASPFTHVEVNASKGPIRYSSMEKFFMETKVLATESRDAHVASLGRR